jgi:solute carrier family 25 citrate transporter 1
MQLRRQTTNRKTVQKKVERMEGRALGSMRDATTTTIKSGGGVSGSSVLDGKGALHRTSAAVAGAADNNANTMGSKTTLESKKNSIKKETVRVTPNVKAATSSSASSSSSGVGGSTSTTSAMHDVGWKQRLPPATSTTSSITSSTTSTVIKSSSSTAAAATDTSSTVVATLGPFGTARRIIQREGPLALYKGLTAVYTGIVPKMAIRFVSFEYYRDVMGGWYNTFNATSATTGGGGTIPPQVTFFAGLLSGLTEAILVVTPAEVCKIRMQSQYHSLMDPTQKTHMKYKNVVQTAALVVKEEGLGALYKGVVPTMLRQGCNQAVNFTAYNWSKKRVLAWKKERAAATGDGGGGEITLDHWQSLLLGGLSGGMGPLVNNPLDVVKTRMQKQVIRSGVEPKYKSLMQSCVVIAKEEGTLALWKGITPRLMRIMPGQAITFMIYEAVSKQMERYEIFD